MQLKERNNHLFCPLFSIGVEECITCYGCRCAFFVYDDNDKTRETGHCGLLRNENER